MVAGGVGSGGGSAACSSPPLPLRSSGTTLMLSRPPAGGGSGPGRAASGRNASPPPPRILLRHPGRDPRAGTRSPGGPAGSAGGTPPGAWPRPCRGAGQGKGRGREGSGHGRGGGGTQCWAWGDERWGEHGEGNFLGKSGARVHTRVRMRVRVRGERAAVPAAAVRPVPACGAPGVLGDVATSGAGPAARRGGRTVAGGCLVTQQNAGATGQLDPSCAPSRAQQPPQPPVGWGGGAWGAAAGSPVGHSR